MPWVIACRVVSFPATARIMKKNPNSSLVRRCPLASGRTSRLVTSPRSSSLRASAAAWAYMNISTVPDRSALAYSGSSLPAIWSLQWKNCA